jgi:uncharacterized protein (DUF2236 family)
VEIWRRQPRREGSAIVAQRLNAERLVLLGWTRAILLQLAHPLIAAGVYDHSSFRATPWAAVSRLHATVRAMLALSFGTDAAHDPHARQRPVATGGRRLSSRHLLFG